MTRSARPVSFLAAPAVPTGAEEARAFLQERLAFLGRTYVLIDLAFYVASRGAVDVVGASASGWRSPPHRES